MFGSSNNGGGFGAFGANNTNNSGGGVFGSGGGFGQQQQQPAAGTGFGQSTTTSAFGAPKASPFGAPATTGTGLFGSATPATNTSTGFGGGFGSNTGTSAFGATNTGTTGGMFGSTPAFGASATTTTPATGGMFGSAGANTGTNAFGASQTTGAFGAVANSNTPPMNGTATVAYTPFEEKEGTTNVVNRYQSIGFMPAYKNWSHEELRVQDYNQNRRTANDTGPSGGAFGAFGANTGFGATNTAATGTGFGAAAGTGGGLFGSTNNQQSTGFGSTTGGFGSTANNTAGNSLFGAPKPATGGLFGSTNTQTTGTGLFGSATPATNAFGASTTGTNAFGATNNTGFGAAANQQKPGGFAFGTQPATTGATGAFGSTTTGGFGATNTGTGLFGQQQQQPAANGFGSATTNTGFGGTGAFGATNTQTTTPFGGATSAFGAQQQKPAFGTGFGTTTSAAPASTGLFGSAPQTQPQQQSTGLFGSKPAFGATPTAPSTGLFGSTQPQQTTSLFGNTQPATTTGGGGLFGSNTTTTAPSTGLFGTAQTQAKPSLFSSTPATQTGLFGSATTQPATGSLFGQQQQPQQQTGLFGSFGQSQQVQQQQQQFTTSIADSPYGNSLLGASQMASPLGPIATPLGSSQTKKAAMIPHHKIAPRQPALTPRLNSSFSRSASPFASSTMGSSVSAGSLGRSTSTNNKLSLFDSDDSILNAGAFSSNGNSRVASLKRLVIDKKIKDQDLFNEAAEPRGKIENGTPRASATKGILKKTVSFDMAGDKAADEDLFGTGALTNPTPTAEELGYVRSTPDKRRATDIDESPRRSATPEVGQVIGNEVAIVQQPKDDKSHGTYWMVPNAAKLKSLTREQQKKVIGLTIGRRGYGTIRFDNPVDITGIPCEIEEIPGTVVVFETRVCTVYPEHLEKPSPGKGLNVPATISLEECYPLTKNQRDKITDPEHPRYITHIRRLKSIKDTEFVEYSPNNGLWIFKVRHFTTYGLVDEDEGEVQEPSFATDATPTPRQPIVTPASLLIDDNEGIIDGDISGLSALSGLSGMDSISGLDDTFEFRRQGGTPVRGGTFEEGGSYEEEVTFDEAAAFEEGDATMEGESFLGEGSVGSIEEDEEPAEPMSEGEEGDDMSVQEMTVIVDDDEDVTGMVDEGTPRGFVMPDADVSPVGTITEATPKALAMGRDWTEQLNNTISPVKRRFGGENRFSASSKTASPVKATMQPLNYGLLDLAADLWGSPSKVSGSEMRKTRKRDQFESPQMSESGFNPIRSITQRPFATFPTGEPFDYDSLDINEQGWRRSIRPTWGPGGMVIYMGHLEAARARSSPGALNIAKINFGIKPHTVPKSLELQLMHSEIRLDEFGIPFAEIKTSAVFSEFGKILWSQDPQEQHEKNVWKLASVLWDPVEKIPGFNSKSRDLNVYLEEKQRKERLSRFLEELVEKDADKHAESAITSEETAFAHLTAHRVEQACAVLLEGGDLRLASLLPMLGSDHAARQRIVRQLEHWRNKGVLAEIPIPVRALYELLAGETCYSEGCKGAAEDSTPDFFFTEYFGLDWKRSLGLKLWYGCLEEEGIAALVKKYEEDFNQFPGQIPAPKPWYMDAHADSEGALDILWGLLRVYSDENLSLEEVLDPTCIGTNKLDFRLPWQLRTFLSARDFRQSEGNHGDQITVEFAEGLEAAGLWEWSLFVIMHLEDADARGCAIKNIIGKNVDDIEEGGKLEFLEKTLGIPRPWIYEAKALKARHSGEHILEAEYLILAKAWTEAHKTIITQVAPEAVISGNLEKLKTILSKFGPSNQPVGWGLGGNVYLDFIRLRDLEKAGSSRNHNEMCDVARRLLGSLKNMERQAFLQNIAVREMAGIVGSFVLKQADMGNEKSRVLELPMTEDQYLKKTVSLGLEFYKAKLQGISAK
ncbi:nuclear protein 96-domain-containing protein [Pyronema omphalodes]|nr:nuclear protein 96-domain-containing protein [Pyronema omphalodes]